MENLENKTEQELRADLKLAGFIWMKDYNAQTKKEKLIEMLNGVVKAEPQVVSALVLPDLKQQIKDDLADVQPEVVAEKPAQLTDLVTQLINQNKEAFAQMADMQKTIEELKAGKVVKTMATRVKTHTVVVAMFDNKYIVGMERMTPTDRNLTWEAAGMPIRVTLMDTEGEREYFETKQTFLQNNIKGIECPILSRKPIQNEKNLGEIEEAYKDADGNIKYTGRTIQNIIIENIGEEFELSLPNGKTVVLLQNVINLTSKSR